MFNFRRVLVAGTALALIHVAVLSPIFAQTQFLGLAQQRATVSIDVPGGSLTEFRERTAALIDAGVHAIQLRDRNLADRELLERARSLRAATEGTSTLFIVNDRPDLAALSRADGVHVGLQQ